MALEPSTTRLLEQLAKREPLDIDNVAIDEFRAYNNEMEFDYDVPKVSMYRERHQSIPGPRGDIPIRIYWPQAPGTDANPPVLVFYHGGGWSICDLDSHENFCRYLCKSGGAVGVSVGYRLAPENKFPAGVEDCFSALRWVAVNALVLGGDPDRICVAGDSAGGNLSAVMCHLAKREGGPNIWKQLLFYPSVAIGDDERYWSRELYGNGDYFLSDESIRYMRSLYVNGEEDFQDFRVSPILADDFSKLPGALVITAECDPLRDEGQAYAECLRSAGVPVDHRCFSGTIHAFMSLAGAIEPGIEALDYAGEFLRKEV